MKRSLLALSSWLLAPAAFAILDTNSNGVSDFWEREFNNGNLFDSSFDPQADPDADGWTNAQEAEAGTNPFDPNPPDGMIRPVTGHIPAVWSEPDEFNEIYLDSPETVTVTWPTLAGKQYTLFFSPDLTQGSWLPVGSPFIAYGGESTYYFDVNDSDKRFWRVSVSDVDSDYDGLANHEEFLAGTNPYAADSDGDTISDWQEFMAGTNPLNQDTDGDGIPDPLDSDPLVSALAFADADGDGIPDAEDAAPNDPRGPAPHIATENASGNPLSNLIKDETVKFVLTVSNPAGPAPTASNLAFFLNGTEETATITAIGSPIGSSQRFLLTWAAKTTANYPTLTIQNLTLRFRDSEQATSWLNLARIDVAEWEGKIITLPFVSSEDSWGYHVMTHINGMKVNQHFVAKNSGTNMVYRGPKTMKVMNSNGGVSDLLLPELAIPYLKISGSPGSPPNVVEQQDYAALATGMDVDFVFNNGSAKSLQFELSQAGINATLSPGQSHFDSVSLVDAVLPLNTHAIIRYLDGTEWKPFFSSNWPVASLAGANSRILRSVNVLTTAAGQLKLHGVTNFMGRDAKITPHASGTVEYPGLPQESVTSEYDQKYMAMGSEEWRKIVIKIYPPQQHFTYSKGYRLNIGTGTTGNAAPQTGWLAQTQSGGTFTPLTIPTDGKIEILATDTDLYPQLTSPEGLVLFIERDATVDQAHILSLDVLPIVETNNPVRLGALNILPVELVSDLNNDGQITASDNPPRVAAFASDASEAIRDEGTEFIFHNDQLSNGIWDQEDSDPAKPANEKDDDDAEKIIIKPRITEGEVWLDHPAIGGLSFYKTRECNAADKVNLSPTSRFKVSSSNPFPDELFMRVDGTLAYPEANPQFEGDLVLKIKVGFPGQEIEAAKMKLTVVKDFGAGKYFQAANDYVMENNTELFVHEREYDSVFFRLCLMREEGTYVLPFELYEPARDNWIQAGMVGNFSAYTYREAAGISEVMDHDPNMTVVINGNQCGFTSGLSSAEAAAMSLLGDPQITDRCQGRLKELNATQSPVSNDHFDENTNIPGTQMKGSALAGPDPLPGTTPPQAGGKYVAQYPNGQISVGPNFAPDFSPPPDPSYMLTQMGGLSSSYTSPDRSNYNNSLVGNAPIGSSGKLMVFVIMGKNGDVGKGKTVDLYHSAVGSGVPLIPGATTPSGSLPPITMVFLDSGVTSCALAYKKPNGTLSLLYKGSKHNGMPYYTNTFLMFQSSKPRP